MAGTGRPSRIGAITVFAADLAASRDFYRRLLGSEPIFEDADSAAFRTGEAIVNVLQAEAVPGLIAPAERAPRGVGSVPTLVVEDVDLTVATLSEVGLEPFSGPVDRPWGLRTVNYRDPDGFLWKLSPGP